MGPSLSQIATQGYYWRMYRDEHRTCPNCTGVLNQRGSVDQCPDCKGTFVATPILQEMVQAMSGTGVDAPVEWKPATDTNETRTCPGCESAMTPVLFASVTADRCEEHGFWFDPKELETALGQIGEDKPEPKEVSFWRAFAGWLLSPRHFQNSTVLAIFDDTYPVHSRWSPRVPKE